MARNKILMVAALLLTFAGIYLIYLGRKAGIQPPVVSGIGFLVIAFVFVGLKNRG